MRILIALIVCTCAHAQFATHVVSFQPGNTGGGGIFVPPNVLGGPRGAGRGSGSFHVLTLGTGGSVTVGFAESIVDGPGVDLIVFENAFFTLGTKNTFSEVAYVEVSSNGVDFLRFPTRFAGIIRTPTITRGSSISPFIYGAQPAGSYEGMTGAMPVLANVTTNAIDPLDPTVAGGEAFDLADLAQEPLVLSGIVDLQSIDFVRIVDLGNIGYDSHGRVIRDNGGTSSADIDAVGAINTPSTMSPGQPSLGLSFDAAGHLVLKLDDADGVSDLDLASLRFSFDLDLLPSSGIAAFFMIDSMTPNALVLRSVLPVTGFGFRGVFAASVRDLAGRCCADQLVLQ